MDHVAAVSVGMVDGKILLDLDYAEDAEAEVDLNLAMTGKGRLVEIQGTAEKEPFPNNDLNSLLELAGQGIMEIANIQKVALEGLVR